MVDERAAESRSPTRRLVLLGASNLTWGFPTVVHVAESFWRPPLQIFAAMGHGRSYGASSTVLGRTLPGLLHCGLWDALAQLPVAQTVALLTDVGNDLVYGAPVRQIVDWVDECLERLGHCGQNIVLTGLPLESLSTVPPWRYLLLRSLAYPASRLRLERALRLADELNARLEELARQRGLPLVRLPQSWYGFDPIHLRPGRWAIAWREILAPWSAEPSDGPVTGPWHRALQLYRLRPHSWQVWGIQRRRAQPCRRLPSGTTIALY